MEFLFIVSSLLFNTRLRVESHRSMLHVALCLGVLLKLNFIDSLYFALDKVMVMCLCGSTLHISMFIS